MTKTSSQQRFAGSLIAAAALATSGSVTSAALNYSTPGNTYTQDFNSLAATNTNAWANNSTIAGIYLFNSTTTGGMTRKPGSIDDIAPATWAPVTDYRTSGGSSSWIYAWGHATENTSDRALGSIAGATSSADPGDLLYALVLRNTSGQNLTSFTLSYTGEQWFSQFNSTLNGPPPAHTLGFSYLLKAGFDANADVPTQNGIGAYTADSRLDFVSPVFGNTSTTSVTTLNGNTTARTELAATINVNWGAGDYLILRFWDDDNAGNDQPIGIDDLSFTAVVPEPAFGGLLLGGLAMLAARRRRSQH